MFSSVSNYEITNKALWQGRLDAQPHERFFQQVQCEDIRTFSLTSHHDPVFLGFCSDEGILREEGRVGARSGPDQIRKQLANLTCHTERSFLDLGNILCKEHDLEDAQRQFSSLIQKCHQHSLKTIAFGGGHEMAWPHFHGLIQYYPNLAILNVSPNYALTPTINGQYATSESSFWQANHYCQQQSLPFNYCCVGIQPTVNTKSVLERAAQWNVATLTAEQMNSISFEKQTLLLDEFIFHHDHLFLSIGLDVFADAFAPGLSTPQPMGLTPWLVLPLLKYIMQTGKVVGLDVAELSPPLDHEQKTARLGAVIVAELLNLKE